MSILINIINIMVRIFTEQVGKRKNSRQMSRREKVTQFLFPYNKKPTKGSTKRLLGQTDRFSKLSGCKTNIQKQ